VIELLKLMENKSFYDEFIEVVSKDSVSKETHTILQDIGSNYEKHDKLDWDALALFMKVSCHPKWDADKFIVYDTIIESVKEYVPTPEMEDVIKKNLIDREYALSIGKVALQIVDNGVGSMGDIEVLFDKWEERLGKAKGADELLVTDDLEEIRSATAAHTGLEWRLNELNMALGRVGKGKLVIVAARPDTGKTSFLMSEATHMLTQLPPDKELVWFNNEEEGTVVKKRIICSLLGINGEEFDANVVDVKHKVEKLIGSIGRIKFIDAPALDVYTIQKFLKKLSPGLVVIDQLWKVHGFSKQTTNDAARTTMLYGKAREWAKQYCPIIVAAQAGGEAGGEKWVEMEHIYGSKTGAQGEADAIITIGRSYDPEVKANARFLNIVKNKFPSPLDESCRNGKFEVKIVPSIGRYEGYV